MRQEWQLQGIPKKSPENFVEHPRTKKTTTKATTGTGPPGEAADVEMDRAAEELRGDAGSSLCLVCVGQPSWKGALTPSSHGCFACHNIFPDTSWSASILRDHGRKGRHLVCHACAKLGSSPDKYDSHECAECLGNFGSLKFEAHLLKDWKRRSGSRMVCKDCQNKLRCGACKQLFDQKSWKKTERDNHRRQGSTLVCQGCRSLGYHPDDVNTYRCQRCNVEYGGKQFDESQLLHHKNHGRAKLECKPCVKDVAEKVKRLQAQFRRSKVKCNCGSRLGHIEKCPLAPVIYGERRWPGCDGHISAEDRDFLNRLNPQPDLWKKSEEKGRMRNR